MPHQISGSQFLNQQFKFPAVLGESVETSSASSIERPSKQLPFGFDLDHALKSSESCNESESFTPLESEAGSSSISHGASDFYSSASPSEGNDSLGPLSSQYVEVQLLESNLVIPKSQYEPFEPGVPRSSEGSAVRLLSKAYERACQSSEGFIEFQLNDFAVYCDNAHHPAEMRALNHLDTKLNHSKFFFDGILSVSNTKLYVRRVPIKALPIGNYGDLKTSTVCGTIWILSSANQRRNVYYKLREPAKEYARFHRPFLWVADLAKHFVDFLLVLADKKQKVTIYHFLSIFAKWVKTVHKGQPDFTQWSQQHPSDDFRTSIVANVAFLYKESVGVLGRVKTHYHTIWDEIWDFNRYKSMPQAPDTRTVVTQYVHDCFMHLAFGDQLVAALMSEDTQKLQNKAAQIHHLELSEIPHSESKGLPLMDREHIRDIKPGSTISTHRDSQESGSQWQREISIRNEDENRWFALVQKVHVDRRGRRKFDVIWCYQPVDTLCGMMRYPWSNELFLSDHCSCGDTCKIQEDEVLGVHDVDFGGNATTSSEFFCRLTYIHAERKWISLKSNHKSCSHMATTVDVAPDYRIGHTFLVHLDQTGTVAEPCELVDIFHNKKPLLFRVRRLLRRQQVDSDGEIARPNELIYADLFYEVNESQLLSRCQVRCFRLEEKIRCPYDRDGVGGFFYITHQQITDAAGNMAYVPLVEFPTSLRQGFDPTIEVPKLRGLDLFCGGGNFGRGLEDPGGIKMNWVNDFNSKAIHTYMANVSEPGSVHPFLGSVDDLQRQAMEGNFTSNVPTIGDVDFISAGSPCPGFSMLTNDKTTEAQRKNQSLVAAFASFVDLYRPKYALLENVPGIVQKKANKNQDVFSQLICALVGLGYQTQFFFLDASSCGAAQRRSRIFVVSAAPGYNLPKKPELTHANPPNTKAYSIGHLPNGQNMAEREMPMATAFSFVSAEAATADLPPIYDAKPDICIPFPDHRTTIGMTPTSRTKMKLIPNRPWGMNFAQAWYGPDRKTPGSGSITATERQTFPADLHRGSLGRTRPNSKAYGRLFPNRPFDAIVTTQSVEDSKNGRQIHWREPRVLTVMEARRAQGFRDEEVLLGIPSAQWKIVGNSVAREVAVALGVVFREAWLGSLLEGDGVETDMARQGVGQSMEEENGPSMESTSLPEYDTGSSKGLSNTSNTPATSIATQSSSESKKRPLQSTLAVELFLSKLAKLERGESPGTRRTQDTDTEDYEL